MPPYKKFQKQIFRSFSDIFLFVRIKYLCITVLYFLFLPLYPTPIFKYLNK